MTIRAITPSDYPAVLSLWNNEIGNKRVTAENIAAHYERMQDDPRYRTFVAERDGETVGFITSVESLAVGFEVGFLHITGLAVKTALHNQGIGTALLQYLEVLAKEKGIYGIFLNSGNQRRAAHEFYKKRGYDPGSICFGKSGINPN